MAYASASVHNSTSEVQRIVFMDTILSPTVPTLA
jgi:hypothetical protein